ncbi:signal peptide-containing protein [Rutstroemia sp. NJR-2017a BVV2]|nr:signal peptide-containing protein [Rutstroemia sp. NJR-2017a BVV2]
MPNSFEAREAEPGQLEARVNCGQILPACNGGSVVGQTNCRCQGQVERCDLWSCPGGSPNVNFFHVQMVCGQEGSGCVWI